MENVFHTFLDLQMHDPDFDLHLHMMFTLCDSVCVQIFPFYDDMGFPDDVSGKESRRPTQEMQEMQVQSLGQEDSPEEGMATHSRILIWRISRTEEPGRIQSIGSHRVERN